MNGGQTNTSGTQVANLGFWPKGFLPKLVALLSGVLTAVKNVVSGSAALAAVDYSASSGSDVLPDVTMEEVARRLIVTVEQPQQGIVQFQPTPPDDHTKPWWPTDPVSGALLGQPKVWNETLGKWIPITDVLVPYVPPLRRRIHERVLGGNVTSTFTFADVGTVDYVVNLAISMEQDDGSYGTPVLITSPFIWEILDRQSTAVTIFFRAGPSTGFMADGYIEVVDF